MAITIVGLYAAESNHETAVLWRAPAGTTLTRIPSPRPASPFRFVKEDPHGRSPKVDVDDANGRRWSVKFGPEVKAETFATRFVQAIGYYADATWFIRRGRITGVPESSALREHIDPTGNFFDARFEYRDQSCTWLPKEAWSWHDNPFAGTRELNGLKVAVMLLSNWDHKDAGDGDSNTGVLLCRGRRIYYLSDWGGSMGKWGRKFFHNKWDCEGFDEQSREFIKGVDGGEVQFGFSSGRGADEFKRGITVSDVRWIVRLLSRITDVELRSALRSSGADDHEAAHFTAALRSRILALERVAR